MTRVSSSSSRRWWWGRRRRKRRGLTAMTVGDGGSGGAPKEGRKGMGGGKWGQ